MSDDKYKQEWDAYFEDGRFIERSPMETLARFVAKYKGEDLKVLDLGFGCGRHIPLLLKMGKVYGIDYSEKALEMAKETASGVDLQICNILEMPYPDAFFDRVVAAHVITHMAPSDIDKAILEIKRVMKKDGVLFLTMIADNHNCYKKGEKIDENTWLLDQDAERGIPQFYCSQDTLKEILKDFEIIDWERTDRLFGEDLKEISSRWVVHAKLK